MDERDDTQKAQDYTAMGHSVDLINAIVAGDRDEDWDAEERQDCVDRNVAHLEIMVGKDDWGSEDMAAANAAITAGQGYTT
jgi:hypothetical protein